MVNFVIGFLVSYGLINKSVINALDVVEDETSQDLGYLCSFLEVTSSSDESRSIARNMLITSASGIFFAEVFRTFFAETFWSLRHCSHLSHSCMKTCRNSIH